MKKFVLSLVVATAAMSLTAMAGDCKKTENTGAAAKKECCAKTEKTSATAKKECCSKTEQTSATAKKECCSKTEQASATAKKACCDASSKTAAHSCPKAAARAEAAKTLFGQKGGQRLVSL